MIKVITALNGENGDIRISINSSLINKFYPNLKGMTLNHKDCPKDLKIEKLDHSTAVLTMASGLDMSKIIPNSNGIAEVPSHLVDGTIGKVLGIVQDFVSGAMMHCIKRTEFIPLYNFKSDERDYSFDEMKGDVVEAMKMKRNLCIIDNFQAYIDNNKTNKYCFNQYMIDYEEDKDEYTDFILMVRAGKLEELRKKYSGKLKYTEWF